MQCIVYAVFKASRTIRTKASTLPSLMPSSTLIERPHPQSAGTTKSQRRVGTHKRQKKNQN
jgi:hypothetical protein